LAVGGACSPPADPGATPEAIPVPTIFNKSLRFIICILDFYAGSWLLHPPGRNDPHPHLLQQPFYCNEDMASGPAE
jgi:hypothetical protein